MTVVESLPSSASVASVATVSRLAPRRSQDQSRWCRVALGDDSGDEQVTVAAPLPQWPRIFPGL
jgi:hypothetical protein